MWNSMCKFRDCWIYAEVLELTLTFRFRSCVWIGVNLHDEMLLVMQVSAASGFNTIIYAWP
jgi:hypothetical protein